MLLDKVMLITIVGLSQSFMILRITAELIVIKWEHQIALKIAYKVIEDEISAFSA